MLSGLDAAVRALGLVASGGKDPSVVAMHKNNESERWMARPLPPALLSYAAHDAEVIAALYARFTAEPWLAASPGTLARIQAASARYVAMYSTRGRAQRWRALGLGAFLPMGFLEDDEDGEGAGERVSCASCELSLPVSYFTTRVDGRGRQQRQTYCRLCHAVARRERRQASWTYVL
ncbi:hypothetical protein FKP32DRAFT_1671126 [Trametes sanguinea]|nr:hypothetical protein FKP32DRAFT_1671126 [Trametes sanguinea]